MFVVKPCSKCGKQVDRRGRYCRSCHNAYMREWRRTHPPSEEERERQRVRAYTHYLIKIGMVKKGACEVCAAPSGQCQAHHTDYSRPELVVWLCPVHHRDHHRKEVEA